MNSSQAGAVEAHWKPLHQPGPYLETQLPDRLPSGSSTACQRCRDQKVKFDENPFVAVYTQSVKQSANC